MHVAMIIQVVQTIEMYLAHVDRYHVIGHDLLNKFSLLVMHMQYCDDDIV